MQIRRSKLQIGYEMEGAGLERVVGVWGGGKRALHLKLPWWKKRAGLEMVRGAGSSDGERK